MDVTEAVKIAKHAARAIQLAGPYADVPYTQDQLCKALIAFVEHVGPNPVSHDEHVKVVRQLTAANARLAKWEKSKPGDVSK